MAILVKTKKVSDCGLDNISYWAQLSDTVILIISFLMCQGKEV